MSRVKGKGKPKINLPCLGRQVECCVVNERFTEISFPRKSFFFSGRKRFRLDAAQLTSIKLQI
eukprot:scaffold5779_cov205-Skeletonema_dohrnii-CCMP3373.AAC.2